MNKAIMSELVILAGSAVLPIKYVVKCRTKIELGLKIVDVCKAKIHTLRKEKGLGKSLVCFQGGTPEVIKIGAAFQNCLQLLIGVETMNNG